MKRPTITHRYPPKHLLQWAALVIFAVVMFIAIMSAAAQHLPVANGAAFDHSQCQYPDRSTNPPDGCDNSDPCDAASAAKGGSGECTDVPKSQDKPMSHNTKTVDNPVDDGDKCQ